MRYVLHIGTNKTGTSTLQHYLGSYRDDLAKAGIHYPKLPGHQYAHHALAHAIKTGDFARHGIDPQSAVTDGAADAEITLFSSEAFHTIQDVAAVARWFPPDRTQVVLYLREHVAYLASWYQQAVQARTVTCSLTDFAVIQVQPASLSALIDRWKAVYGANLNVRFYERSQLKGEDIVTDFFSVAFDRALPVERTFTDKNPTISGNLLFLKLFMNHFLSMEESTEIVEELSALSLLDPRFGGKLAISVADARRIAHVYAADRRRLRDEFKIRMKPPKEGISGNPTPDFGRLREDIATLMATSKARNFAWHGLVARKLDLLTAALG